MRILVLEDHSNLRAALRMQIEQAAKARGVIVELIEASGYDEAVGALNAHAEFDVLLIDVRLQGERDGLDFLALARKRGVKSPAFVLTIAPNYDIEARSSALDARYVPKEGLNLIHLVSRLFPDAPSSSQFAGAERRSGVRLAVSVEEVGAYLAHAPGGLHDGIALARKSAVRQAVDEHGTHVAAAKALGITRQNVGDILHADDDDEEEAPATVRPRRTR